MKYYEMDTYLSLCDLAGKEEIQLNKQKDAFELMPMLNLPSVSFVYVGSKKGYIKDKVTERIIHLQELEQEISEKQKVIDDVSETIEFIEPAYKEEILYVFFQKEENGKKHFAKQMADKYHDDHRLLKKELLHSIDTALQNKKMQKALNKIETYVRKQDMKEYIAIFNESGKDHQVVEICSSAI